MNYLEIAIRETILEKIKDFNLFFNQAEISVWENKECNFADIKFETKINISQRIGLKELKELRKENFDLLEWTTKKAYKQTQEVFFEELGNTLEKDKDGLKLIVSSSIPEGMILCDPKTAHRVGMLRNMLDHGDPSFRKEFQKLLEEGVECETYL